MKLYNNLPRKGAHDFYIFFDDNNVFYQLNIISHIGHTQVYTNTF